MAIFEYAICGKTNKLIHIDDVLGGLKCNCVCPGCGDQMVARKGKIKEHHFAHYIVSEKDSCRMTMIHRFFQEYFTVLDFLEIPEIEMIVHDTNISIPRRNLRVLSAQKEIKIGSYRADVLLKTSIGEIIIEICVTHKSTLEKIDYYKINNVAAIEYDFSSYKDRPIEEAITALKYNILKFEWIRYFKNEYYFSKVIKERCYLNKLIKSRTEKIFENDDVSKQLFLPELKHCVEIDYENKAHRLEITLLKRGVSRFEYVCQYFIDGCYVVIYTRKSGFLKVLYLPSGCDIPLGFRKEKNSVLVKTISHAPRVIESSSWLHYAPLQERLSNVHDEVYAKFSHVKKIEFTLSHLVESYLQFNKDEAFGLYYKKWRKWLIKNNMVRKGIGYSIKIPDILKTYKNDASFWMFNSWSIFVLVNLIQIIDQFELGNSISYGEIFKGLSDRFYLNNEYINILKEELECEYISENKKKLIMVPYVIRSMVSGFISHGYIQAFDGYLVKNINLLPLLVCEFHKVNEIKVPSGTGKSIVS
ncbi:hypothetical protein K6U37_13580 [Vibrio parahaemolyticus]|uniref:hypothetical protein n=1 Tax=Vibrio parahaemolyticus TaxID=670 RepID=UPI001EE9F389|nr:hypothetical protein [Vibrio parahaemolyticus]MCG6489980.1 hypothetical protein [Vibrio parahaemolyticus]